MIKFEVKTFNLKELEGLAVRNAMTYTKGNVQFARELLNVSKATMYRLLRVYDIDFNTIREYNEWKHIGWKTKKNK